MTGCACRFEPLAAWQGSAKPQAAGETPMIPDDLRKRLAQHGQDHLVETCAQLPPAEREHLVREIERVDLAELQALYAKRTQKDALPERHRIQPLPHPSIDAAQADAF